MTPRPTVSISTRRLLNKALRSPCSSGR
jgi:hypothetical protein